MGSSISQEIQGAANVSFSAVYDTSQDCITAGSQGQQFTARCPFCRNPTVNFENNRLRQVAIYNTQCLAQVEITNDLQTEINQDFATKAEAVAQQFQLSGASVRQVVDISSTIANDISSETSQTCASTVGQTQGATFECGGTEEFPQDTCVINIRYNDFSQRYEPLTNCLLENRQATRVMNEVIQKIVTEGSARTESIFGPIIFVVIIILCIVGYTYTQGTKALTDWRLWAIVIVLILLYLIIAYLRKWFPFDVALS